MGIFPMSGFLYVNRYVFHDKPSREDGVAEPMDQGQEGDARNCQKQVPMVLNMH